MEFVTSPAEITPEWVTARLRESLGPGMPAVTEVKVVNTWPMLVSVVAVLELTYAAEGAAPRRLFCKMRRPKAPVKVGAREVAFYTQVARRAGATPAPRCYGCASNADTGDFFLLLEDLSETHQHATEWPVTPTIADFERIIDAFARLHGAWWRDAELLREAKKPPTVEQHQEYARGAQDMYAKFADFMHERLSPRRRRMYERALGVMDKVMARQWDRGHVSLTHGDSHVWNVMVPKDPAGMAYLIDWDLWNVGPVAVDLAYTLALFQYPQWRAEFEKPLLRRYCDTLASCGVPGCAFEALWEDYRLGVIRQLVAPLWQQTHRIPAGVWWTHCERITSAYEDLGCDEVVASLM